MPGFATLTPQKPSFSGYVLGHVLSEGTNKFR